MVGTRVKRYWVAPGATTLQANPNQATTESYLHQIERLFSNHDIGVMPVKETQAPQVVTCHYDLFYAKDHGKIKNAAKYISMALHTPVTVVTSQEAHFAIEVIKRSRGTAFLRETMLCQQFDQSTKTTAIVGVDTVGKPIMLDIAKAPHVLIAGSTGSGKSVLLNSMITSLLCRNTPSTLKLILVDPKQVEFDVYSGIPQLMAPIAKGPANAIKALQMACNEMDERYYHMQRRGIKYRPDDMPPLFVVIDELTDLMLTSKSAVESYIVRIAQLGRAAGIHLIIATQRPTVNVITGLIKANITTRIALTCASNRDSITILDHKGAETLTGKGDAILKQSGTVEETRMQSTYCNDADIRSVVNYWRDKNRCIQER